ncbi:cytosolic sulfotransferase 15-like [Iris pallida]|uniref:Cytosolic sulfotransferase 15-like n=1 Tax=Iris pallida TaxID=29817 RepID=A0AAX6H142_IRIPA|nr:cytosolic sulfotransferase 15-like [Iris pallida]
MSGTLAPSPYNSTSRKGTHWWGLSVAKLPVEDGEELRLTVAKSRALSHVVPDLGKVARMMSVGLASNSFRTIMAATMGGIGRKKPSWKQRSG